MLHSSIVRSSAAALVVLARVLPAAAEFSPETAAEHRRQATDVFQVEVVGIRIEERAGTRTLVTARVVGVVRSGDPTVRGRLITIDSCPFAGAEDPTAEELAELIDRVIGPAAAPRVEVGWRGSVYLKPRARQARIYDLVAEGQGYVPEWNERDE